MTDIILPNGQVRKVGPKEQQKLHEIELDFLMLIRKYYKLAGLGPSFKGERQLKFEIPPHNIHNNFMDMLATFLKNPGQLFSMAYAPEINDKPLEEMDPRYRVPFVQMRDRIAAETDCSSVSTEPPSDGNLT